MKRFCVLILCVLSAWSVVRADEPAPPIRLITVNGTAVINAVPDEIVWTMSVSANGAKVAEAKKASDQKLQRLLAAARELGVSTASLQTGQMSITRREKKISAYESVPNGFAVTRGITLKQQGVDQFEKYFSKFAESTDFEASYRFSSSREIQLRAEARRKALAEAKAKATDMAETLGAKVKSVWTINENAWQAPMLVTNSVRTEAGDDAAGNGTFAPGTIEIRASVQVAFSLE
jgi:uncharacterized protein YggE